MLVADSVVELSNDLGAISDIVVAPITCHLRVMELPRVLVSIVECGYSLTLKETELEVTFKDSIGVVEDTETMHLASSELSLIEEFRA